MLLPLSTLAFSMGCLSALAWSARMPVPCAIGRVRFFFVVILATGAYLIEAAGAASGVSAPLLAISTASISFFLTMALVLRCRDLGIGAFAGGLLMFLPGGLLIPVFFRGNPDPRTRLPRTQLADGLPAIMISLAILLLASSYALSLRP